MGAATDSRIASTFGTEAAQARLSPDPYPGPAASEGGRHVIEQQVLFALTAVVVVVAVRWLADRVHLPFTVLLTVVGAVYAVLPGPNVALDPAVALTVVIPPLLYNAALGASLLDIRRYAWPILSLSVGLVLATALAIGSLLPLVVAGLGFPAALALGAAVAPPDPVAALSIGRRVGLRPHVIALIEGEGLLNDATALTLLQVAVAAVAGSGLSLALATGSFLLSGVGGIVVGAAIALPLSAIRPLRDDAMLAPAVSLATPFACYLAGEALHVSGVLAVVVAGLIAGHKLLRGGTSAGRLQVTAVWRIVDFLLQGFVFLLIGNQLTNVVHALERYRLAPLLAAVGITLAVGIGLRPLWLVATQLPRRLRRLNADQEPLGMRDILMVSWAGTRGVITLAAAYSLPLSFPQRPLLLLCAFVLVAVTLLGQGLTFAPLARRLGVSSSVAAGIRERNEARLAAADAALERLESLTDMPDEAREGMRRVLEERRRRYRRRLKAVVDSEDGQPPMGSDYLAAVAARRSIIQAERDELLRWREHGRLSEPDLRRLQAELDHQESQLPPLT